MLERYAGATIGTKRLIAEGLLKGEQVTVEGYRAWRQGDDLRRGRFGHVPRHARLLALRLSVTPCRDGVQTRMGEIAATTDAGARLRQRHVQYRNDVRRRSRSASRSSRSIRAWLRNLPIFTRRSTAPTATPCCSTSPKASTPRFTRRQGRYAFAASCVLRSFEDYLVAAVPSEADIERLARIYPDIRVELHATPGRKLSDEFQDGKSYRYGVVNLGGRDLADVLEQFASCRTQLGIELRAIRRRRAAASKPRRRPSNSAHRKGGRERQPSAA